MDLILNETQTDISMAAKRLCEDLGRKARREDGAQSSLALRAFADAGYVGLLVPENVSGAALGASELALVLTEIGRNCLAAPVSQQMVSANVLAETANDDLRNRWLPSLLRGDAALLLAIEGAYTSSYGSEQRYPLAERHGQDVRIRGIQAYVVNATHRNGYIVAAVLPEGGDCLCVVEHDAPGVSVRATLAVDGSHAEELQLENVLIPATSILATGIHAHAMRRRATVVMNLAVSAELLGLSEAVQRIACDHLNLRSQFGRLLGANQVLQHRVVDNFVAIELLKSLVWSVANALDAGRYHSAMGAALKVKAVKTAFAVTRATLQMLGAIGYTAEHPVGDYYRRAILLSISFGTEAQKRSEFSKKTGLETELAPPDGASRA
jgi:alkylation response protein AidB-like acyl-CoA dehydrogenase